MLPSAGWFCAQATVLLAERRHKESRHGALGMIIARRLVVGFEFADSAAAMQKASLLLGREGIVGAGASRERAAELGHQHSRVRTHYGAFRHGSVRAEQAISCLGRLLMLTSPYQCRC